ncbi:hypothetical protein KGF57_003789 [Candida theae]|uniref:DNA polymerase delta subunit 3 n=1 Tax=Candida theae TaxID=1198502 RepID=A0AAD5FXH9_9ASCO|nr:uncharacterized protein KGF57_003789 [Candida theae]KAI5954766.1 hypothetical protein KGF57_003789 [Candida theae]
MTMEAPVSEIEYLASEVILNSNTVSYRKFSRQLSIPISQAKQTLYEYYTKNKEQVSASFVITGAYKDGVKGVKFSENEEKLKHDVEKFDSITTIHVFCVMKKELVFTRNEIALEELKTKSQLSKKAEYEKNGMIIGPKIDTSSIQESATSTSTATATGTTPLPPSIRKSDDQQKATPSKSSGLSSSYVSRKQQSQQAKPVYTSRKQETSTSQKRASTEPATPSYQYKSRKLEQKQPKERIVMGNLNKDQNDDDDAEPKRQQAPPPTTDLEKLFDEDETFQFSDDDDVGVNEKRDIGSQPAESTEVVANTDAEVPPEGNGDAAAEEAKKEPEEELFVDEEEEGGEANKDDDMETVQEVDEDGYTVTKRKPKSVTKPKRKPVAPKRSAPSATTSKVKKASTDGKKKTQTSLMSFFGKR